MLKNNKLYNKNGIVIGMIVMTAFILTTLFISFLVQYNQ